MDVLKRWQEYFDELLHVRNDNVFEKSREDRKADTEDICVDEIHN